MEGMHEYYLKDKELKTQKIIIIIASVVFAFIISIIINWFSNLINTNLWWLEVPSIIGVYNMIKSIVDNHWWAKVYRIPDFNGIWNGYIQSSIDNYTSTFPVTCRIKQNAKLLSVVFEMEKSTSYSISAIVDDTKINGSTLEYDYINIPKIEQSDLLNVHLGSAMLKLEKDVLKGEYYNKQRNTRGSIYLEKKEKK